MLTSVASAQGNGSVLSGPVAKAEDEKLTFVEVPTPAPRHIPSSGLHKVKSS